MPLLILKDKSHLKKLISYGFKTFEFDTYVLVKNNYWLQKVTIWSPNI